ncbi:MAG TPA: DUF1080 domain-containing protein [Planctomycetaceae bacterium]|jgi:hypothetical protein|nr:DUF1080 domain-containing protein [Planctomycetaceae bacterium]
MNGKLTGGELRIAGRSIAAVVLLFGTAVCGRLCAGDPPEPAKETSKSAPQAAGGKADDAKAGWQSLFDGRTLKDWKSTDFGGEGPVEVKDGAILLGVGNDLTGVNFQRLVPHRNYEVSLEARRVDGSDFFCGLTFPVKEDPCSLIIGGWGGGVCGLSSIDGLDASENSTTKYKDFDTGRWYTIRLRVTDAKIEAWIDKEQIVNQKLAGKKISIRSEVEASRPFGIASYRTQAALRNIRLRELK